MQLLDEIDEHGIEEIFQRRSDDHDCRALLAAWINTPTWSESLDFFREYQAVLTTDDSRAILDSIDDDDARQHLAILYLTGVMPVEQVYTVVTDPAVAEEAAFAAIEAGDLLVLSAIRTAAPELQTRPTAWGLIVSVLLLAQDEPDQAHQFGRQVTEQATVIQRRAHTIRLCALRSHHPDLPGLDDLIQIIDPEIQRAERPRQGRVAVSWLFSVSRTREQALTRAETAFAGARVSRRHVSAGGAVRPACHPRYRRMRDTSCP